MISIIWIVMFWLPGDVARRDATARRRQRRYVDDNTDSGDYRRPVKINNMWNADHGYFNYHSTFYCECILQNRIAYINYAWRIILIYCSSMYIGTHTKFLFIACFNLSQLIVWLLIHLLLYLFCCIILNNNLYLIFKYYHLQLYFDKLYVW